MNLAKKSAFSKKIVGFASWLLKIIFTIELFTENRNINQNLGHNLLDGGAPFYSIYECR